MWGTRAGSCSYVAFGTFRFEPSPQCGGESGVPQYGAASADIVFDPEVCTNGVRIEAWLLGTFGFRDPEESEPPRQSASLTVGNDDLALAVGNDDCAGDNCGCCCLVGQYGYVDYPVEWLRDPVSISCSAFSTEDNVPGGSGVWFMVRITPL